MTNPAHTTAQRCHLALQAFLASYRRVEAKVRCMTSKTKWTHGIRVERGNVGDRHPLFLVAPGKDGLLPWSDEDALLFAAAEDLYAALEELLPEGWDDGVMDHIPGVRASRLALAKARGEAPEVQAGQPRREFTGVARTRQSA